MSPTVAIALASSSGIATSNSRSIRITSSTESKPKWDLSSAVGLHQHAKG